MKVAIVFLVLVAAVLALPRTKRQIFGDSDPNKVPEIMNNPSAVKAQITCLLAADDVKCDPIGKKLKANIPKAIEMGDCPSACTDIEKKAISTIIISLEKNYASDWEKLKTHYKATPEQLTKLKEFTTKTGSL